MTLGEARTAIRAETSHDSDTQVTDAQLDERINTDHSNVRRKIAMVAPQIYTETDHEQTLAAGEDTLEMPLDYERLIRVERQYGTEWYDIEASDELGPHRMPLNVREEANGLKVAPLSQAAGVYRIIYVMEPEGLVDDGDELDVPSGFEDIIVQLGCAFVRRRHEESQSAHLEIADRVWKEQKPLLRKRYGRHAVPGMRQVRRW